MHKHILASLLVGGLAVMPFALSDSATAKPGNSHCSHHRCAPSPSPTPTPTPTPSPTETSPAGVCTNPVFTTSTSNDGYSDGPYYVHNNMWNADAYGVTQTLEVCSAQSWNVTTTADNSTGDGAVKTYPNVHKDYDNNGVEPALASFPVLTSTFAGYGPNTGIYNIAYDIWLNGVADPGSSEVMVWTDNQAQFPAGDPVAHVTISGRTWTLYATADNSYLAFVADQDVSSGSVDLKAMFDVLVSQGRIPATSTLGQLCYGVEVVSTNGQPGTFNFTDFSVTDA